MITSLIPAITQGYLLQSNKNLDILSNKANKKIYDDKKPAIKAIEPMIDEPKNRKNEFDICDSFGWKPSDCSDSELTTDKHSPQKTNYGSCSDSDDEDNNKDNKSNSSRWTCSWFWLKFVACVIAMKVCFNYSSSTNEVCLVKDGEIKNH